ncbi:MAG: hypothetical protein A2603_08955 [Bdellovibrionales bacterium RIFOXYD1_FULL_55_31]|nr:MAG: hypothetical protein A2603_08955 [Bdellovibrionales bacterium RIFOXYD1_FULL_55_31]
MAIQMGSNGRLGDPVLPELDNQANSFDLFCVHHKAPAEPRETERRNSNPDALGFSSCIPWPTEPYEVQSRPYVWHSELWFSAVALGH